MLNRFLLWAGDKYLVNFWPVLHWPVRIHRFRLALKRKLMERFHLRYCATCCLSEMTVKMVWTPRLTMYEDDTGHWSCKDCDAEEKAHWAEMWDEYYRGQGVY